MYDPTRPPPAEGTMQTMGAPTGVPGAASTPLPFGNTGLNMPGGPARASRPDKPAGGGLGSGLSRLAPLQDYMSSLFSWLQDRPQNWRDQEARKDWHDARPPFSFGNNSAAPVPATPAAPAVPGAVPPVAAPTTSSKPGL